MRGFGHGFCSIVRPLAVVAGASLALAMACSAGSNDDESSSNDDGTASSNNSGSGGGLITTSGAGGSGDECAGESYIAEEQPLDMYIMLDQSGSMSDPVSNGDKWSAVTGALSQFVQLPDTAGIGVGIQYFPLQSGQMCPLQCLSDTDCGSCGPCFGAFPPQIPGICMNFGGDSCNAADYATPEVAIAELPGVAGAIQSSMGSHGPSGGTPTSAALQGAIDYARAHGQANPNHVVIVVLATDGDPTSCDPNIGNIQAIAANGVSGAPSILTFVIGVGGSLSNLHAIAQGGGTQTAFLVDTNQNVTQQFLDALNQIKGAALGCTYNIPLPAMGSPDYNSVNVKYKPGGSDTWVTIPKVGSAAQCPATGDAWYYDDNTNPTKIILCDAVCGTVAADDQAEVNIELGCATVIE